MSDTDQDICPNCKVDLCEEYIWDHFFKIKGSEEEATRVAEMYGATREKGCFGKVIGIYSYGKDRTVAFRGPECNHEWKRT